MRIKIIFIIILTVIFLLIFHSFHVIAEINYDITYKDPQGDVKYINGDNNQKVTGHEDIDIIEIKSYKKSENLTIEMKVVGRIKNSPNIIYSFEIAWLWNNDLEGSLGYIYYLNGNCSCAMVRVAFECETKIIDNNILNIIVPPEFVNNYDISASKFQLIRAGSVENESYYDIVEGDSSDNNKVVDGFDGESGNGFISSFEISVLLIAAGIILIFLTKKKNDRP